MNNPLIVKNDITINSPASAVWDALVNPEKTKVYMFGCEAISDWNEGDPLLWTAPVEGKEVVFVKGNIVAIEPARFLAFTTIDPNSDIPDIPENYTTVEYRLTTDGHTTTLHVTQGDYATVANGAERYQETMAAGGWESVLKAIKSLVEST